MYTHNPTQSRIALFLTTTLVLLGLSASIAPAQVGGTSPPVKLMQTLKPKPPSLAP